MTFTECILTMVQRPGYLGVLADKRVIRLNAAGYIMDATKEFAAYPRFNTTDVMAVTWECWTPQQLVDMTEAGARG